MGTSFIVVADPAGTARHDAAARLEPAGRWTNPTGTVEVCTWADEGWVEDHLVADELGIVAWGGWPVPVGSVGRPTAAGSALRAAASRPTSRRWDGLRGTWGAVVLDATGAGRAFGDPLGLRPLYRARHGGATVIGTDPHHVAAACTEVAPRRDVLAAAALGAVAIRLPRRSGYEGVDLLDPGASATVAADGSAAIERPGPPWLELGDLADARRTELLGVVRAELRSGIETVLQLGEPTVELTGGKDSRLVLATLLELGVAATLPFETSGPPGLPDVEIAEQIAATYGLHHTRVFRRAAAEPLPFPELFARFVEATAGMVSGWDARPIVPRSGALRISGLNGEALRTHRRIEPSWSVEQVAALVAQTAPTSSLGLARRELVPLLATAFDDELERARERTADPHDLVDSFLLAVQTRQQYGPLDALQPADRFLPLSSLRAIRAAFALGGRPRHAELVHHALIASADPALAAVPFAGDRWPSDLATHVDGPLPDLAPIRRPPRALPDPGRATERRPGRPSAPTNLMASLHRHLAADRRATLDEHLGNPTNPVWDLLDRQAAIDALGRYEELGPKQRKELYGAATAACWVAG